MHPTVRAAAIGLAACLLAACSTLPGGARAPGEPLPQVIEAVARGGEALASCGGGDAFPFAALDGPSAENEVGPEFDALRSLIAEHSGWAPEFPAARNWRLVVRTEERAVFVADSTRGLIYAVVRRQAGAWAYVGSGDCNLHAVQDGDSGAAHWWPDPRRPAPTADSDFLEVLVMEHECAGGSYATGRIVAPLVEYGADSITITLGVRMAGGIRTCQSNPATPAVLILSEPIGNRILLDGHYVPPAPPRAAD